LPPTPLLGQKGGTFQYQVGGNGKNGENSLPPWPNVPASHREETRGETKNPPATEIQYYTKKERRGREKNSINGGINKSGGKKKQKREDYFHKKV